MTTVEVWMVIVAVSLGAFASRALFFLQPDRREPPAWVGEFLDLLPAAAFAALVAPAVLAPDGQLDLLSARTASAALAIVVAWRTDSMALTLVAGLVVVAVLS